jgi:hypothetical protein
MVALYMARMLAYILTTSLDLCMARIVAYIMTRGVPWRGPLARYHWWGSYGGVHRGFPSNCHPGGGTFNAVRCMESNGWALVGCSKGLHRRVSCGGIPPEAIPWMVFPVRGPIGGNMDGSPGRVLWMVSLESAP